MLNKLHKNPKSGFTLIELLVVVAIIGLLATIILAALASARKKALDAQVISEEYQIRLAMELYYNNNGGYPGVGFSQLMCIGGTDCQLAGSPVTVKLGFNGLDKVYALSQPKSLADFLLPKAYAASTFTFNQLNTAVMPGGNKGFIYLTCSSGSLCPVGSAQLIYATNANGVVQEAVGIWHTSSYTPAV